MNIEAQRDIAKSNIIKEFEDLIAMLSNPNDKKKLQDAITEISNSMTRIDAERDFQRDAIIKVADDTGVDKKYVKQLATMYHKQTFVQVQTEREEVESLYEDLFG